MKVLSTPKQDGFRMPGEFEPHEGCWMIWPDRPDNWRLKGIPAKKAFAEVAATINNFEQVYMCVQEDLLQEARELLDDSIEIKVISSDDAWMRDVGPTFVINDHGELRGIDWRFNAWGGNHDGLYSDWTQDDLVAKNVCESLDISCYSLESFVLEGGSIHVDGEGTCIVTEACLLSKGRNPNLSKFEIETYLKTYLNVEKVLWLPRGIYLDETNEHVDNIIHYCHPGVIALAWTDDITDPQYELSKLAYDFFKDSKDAKGRSFVIHKLHIPTPILITEEEANGVETVDGTLPRNPGDRQAASYANFYIANDAIIFPTFNDEKYDEKAKEVLKEIFPKRQIIGVYAREIILGGGNIHCITQQQPKV